jgi:hypothetical protein
MRGIDNNDNESHSQTHPQASLSPIILNAGYENMHHELVTQGRLAWCFYDLGRWSSIEDKSDKVKLMSPLMFGACLALVIGYTMDIASEALGVRSAAVSVLGTGVFASVSASPSDECDWPLELC